MEERVRLDDAFSEADVFSRSFKQSGLVDGALSVIAQDKMMGTLLHPWLLSFLLCLSLFDLFLEVQNRLLLVQPGRQRLLVYLGEEQCIHVADFSAAYILGVVVCLHLPALQLGELPIALSELAIGLVHDFANGTHV